MYTNVNNNDTPLHPDDVRLHRITTEAMQKALGYKPKEFQLKAISHILKMNNNSPLDQNKPRSTLLVQGTGGGKTSVYQTIAVVKRGVNLIIQNTLSLSSDQISKIDKIRANIPNTFALQLDSIKSNTQKDRVCNQLNNITHHMSLRCVVFLFSSPETLLLQPWSDMIKSLINRNILKFICIDEAHLFVNYGMTFRPSFIRLRDDLFKHIKSENNDGFLHIPLLYMTATFDAQMLFLIQKMTGISLSADSIIWSDASNFDKRNISIHFTPTRQRMRIFKQGLQQCIGPNLQSKAIIYSSVAKSTETIQDEIDTYLDESTSPDGDTILINGDMESEWKFVSAQSFTKHQNNVNELISNNLPYPRILIATSGCIGAGLDSDDVDLVLRDGFPSSIMDFIQEMGRCGRGYTNTQNSKRNHGLYHLIVNSTSLTYLVSRIYEESEEMTDENKAILNSVMEAPHRNAMELKNIIDVLRLCYLKIGCWHHYLENTSAYTHHQFYNPCKTKCPYCLGTQREYIMPVRRVGLVQFLVHLFFQSSIGLINMKVIIKAMEEFNDVGKTIYGRSTSTAPPRKFIESTVLQLISSHILVFKITEIEGKKNLVLNLYHVDDLGTPAYIRDEYWQYMYLI